MPEKVREGLVCPEMGHFMGARGFLCPKRVFRARKGAGGKHTSRNGTFRGRKGLFVPKKGVSCKNRCRREYPSPHGTFRGHKGLFSGRVGRFVNKWEGRWMSRQQISQERGRRGLRCRRENVFSWVSPDVTLVGLFQLFVGRYTITVCFTKSPR